jgi:6,7-dimethyl-8-ribityllumazine synthase
MAAQKMAGSGKFDAVVALGVVIQGATPHADLINAQVSRALGNMALETGVPVINGVVSAGNLEQAIERSGTKAGNKGWAAAQAAIEMANLFKCFET